MTHFTFLALVLCAAVASAVVHPTEEAANNEAVQALKTQAEGKDPDDQVEMFVKVAELQLRTLTKAYDSGTPEQAEAALKDVLDYGVKAAKSSQETRKRMKQTEIAIRKITNRLEGLSRTLSFDERQPMATTIKQLEGARSELLHSMFKKR